MIPSPADNRLDSGRPGVDHRRRLLAAAHRVNERLHLAGLAVEDLALG